jgi:hypothetical protein
LRPQQQRFRFASQGVAGDCHRTCIAMILNMHRDDVPHFMEGLDPSLPPDHPSHLAAERAELEWLARRGLTVVDLPFPGGHPLSELLEQFTTLAHGAPLILKCTATGGDHHSVVIVDGEVHNPNSSEVVGPMRDGFWWVAIYATGPGWRTPLLRDRVRGLLRSARLRCEAAVARVRRQEEL